MRSRLPLHSQSGYCCLVMRSTSASPFSRGPEVDYRGPGAAEVRKELLKHVTEIRTFSQGSAGENRKPHLSLKGRGIWLRRKKTRPRRFPRKFGASQTPQPKDIHSKRLPTSTRRPFLCQPPAKHIQSAAHGLHRSADGEYHGSRWASSSPQDRRPRNSHPPR